MARTSGALSPYSAIQARAALDGLRQGVDVHARVRDEPLGPEPGSAVDDREQVVGPLGGRPHGGDALGQGDQVLRSAPRRLAVLRHRRVQVEALCERVTDRGRVHAVLQLVEPDVRQAQGEQREEEVGLLVVPPGGLAGLKGVEEAAQVRADSIFALVHQPVVTAVDDGRKTGREDAGPAVVVGKGRDEPSEVRPVGQAGQAGQADRTGVVR